MARVLEDTTVWQPRGRFTTLRWSPCTPGTYPRTREIKIKVAGFVALLHMVLFRAGPDPISPFLLRLAIEGRARACTLDPPFLRLLDADMYRLLTPWASYDRTQGLPEDPTHPLMSLLLGTSFDVSHFMSCQYSSQAHSSSP